MMKEFKLVGTLFFVLIFQLLLLPFRAIAFIFAILEGAVRVVKDTINNLIKSIKSEVLK